MKKINVDLYGGKSIFGGREQPYNVDISYCDKCEQCDFYKNNSCFNAGRIKPNCKIGEKRNIQSFTSKSQKGRDFARNWKLDESYSKLEEPNRKIGFVDDVIILNIDCMKLDENNIPIEDVHFNNGELSYIKREYFTPDLIKKICDLRPKTLFGNSIIESYYKEEIPHFLDDLKREYNDIYLEFINQFPEYDKEINYVGRKAYINTLKNGSELKDCHSNIWKIENDELVCYKWGTWLPFGGKPTETRIKITDDMIYKITDNSQVDEKTKFEN